MPSIEVAAAVAAMAAAVVVTSVEVAAAVVLAVVVSLAAVVLPESQADHGQEAFQDIPWLHQGQAAGSARALAAVQHTGVVVRLYKETVVLMAAELV